METRKKLNASQYIDELLSNGRHTFMREEARKKLRVSSWATYLALRRLAKAGRVVMPRSGFYVIVEPQYRSVGTLPPEWFIHTLMAKIGKPYYVGLLSAAQLYGAAHHQPMEFQVVVPGKSVRPIHVGNVRIRFFGKGRFGSSEMTEVKTPTGYQKVSTPETTALDLVRYSKHSGGLDNVITVLSELSEKLDAKKLLATAKKHDDILTAQRLGWLLESLKERDLAKGLAAWVEKKNPPIRPLEPGSPLEKSKENERWRLLINANPVPEA